MESSSLSRDMLVQMSTVCMYCNRQRCRQGFWRAVNPSCSEPTSHGICPTCFRGALEDIKGQIAHELKGQVRLTKKTTHQLA